MGGSSGLSYGRAMLLELPRREGNAFDVWWFVLWARPALHGFGGVLYFRGEAGRKKCFVMGAFVSVCFPGQRRGIAGGCSVRTLTRPFLSVSLVRLVLVVLSATVTARR